jgi:hypothetical protein
MMTKDSMPRAKLSAACLAAAMAAAAVLLPACGGEEAGDDGAVDGGSQVDAIPPAERHLPLATGRTWTWTVTPPAPAAAYDKVQTVGALEDVGGTKAGVMAFRVETLGDDHRTVSWQEDTGQAVRRHKEETYAPGPGGALQSTQVYVAYKLRLDEAGDRIGMGDSYTESYTETESDPGTGTMKTTAKVETWTVEAVDEMVTVPAGTFPCVRIKRMGDEAGDAVKTYWFAKGVGKVKEVGSSTEELKSFGP